MKARVAVALFLFVTLLQVAAVADGSAAEQLEKRRQELRVQLLRERVLLLRQDPEAMELHQRIQRLYRELDAVLAAKPSIRKLQAELRTIEKSLETSARNEPER